MNYEESLKEKMMLNEVYARQAQIQQSQVRYKREGWLLSGFWNYSQGFGVKCENVSNLLWKIL